MCVSQAVTVQGATASDCQPWCLHIFAAVDTNISETRCDGSSQVWSQLMMREQLLEPLIEQSTCYGLFWFLWRISGCHSLEGVAWSRPISSTRRNSKTLVRKPRIDDCLFWRLCVCLSSSDHAGATAAWLSAVATNISETRCDGSSQVWSQLMMREQLLEPLIEQSTCYGLFWFLWRICGCHSLEGVAWSRPISTRRNVLVFCRVPLTCSLGIHLERLPLGSLWVLRR